MGLYLYGVQGVASSNLVAPTNSIKRLRENKIKLSASGYTEGYTSHCS
jgi:hypothetical protein